jgi:hypothetical protein
MAIGQMFDRGANRRVLPLSDISQKRETRPSLLIPAVIDERQFEHDRIQGGTEIVDDVSAESADVRAVVRGYGERDDPALIVGVNLLVSGYTWWVAPKSGDSRVESIKVFTRPIDLGPTSAERM